jgi:hypothetical protein
MMDIEKALERVARRLRQIHGDRPIPRAEMVRQVSVECGCARGSVIPSDYCYDRINDGIRPREHAPMFVHEGRGLYRFVGRNYPYDGPLYHHPKSGLRQQVGQWVAGRLQPFGGKREKQGQADQEPIR